MIDESILKESNRIAQEIFNLSYNLKAGEIRADYVNREEYWQELLKEKGYITFTPTVRSDLGYTFQEMAQNDFYDLCEQYSCVSEEDCNFFETEIKLTIATKLLPSIRTEHILNNKVPSMIVESVKEMMNPEIYSDSEIKVVKKYWTQKLSKLLVKLFGEKSDTVKWYTCKCPKLEIGQQDDWVVTVSILPHHIAGMSYYAPLNHGGSRWLEGWEGTSCMDPIKNGRGYAIFGLAPAMRESTLAIAYLSKADTHDPWNPVYEARALLRVFYVNDEPHFIVCRPYFTSHATKHILVDGLKNYFPNAHVAEEVKAYYRRQGGFPIKDTDIIEYPVNFKIKDISEFVKVSITCPECGGRRGSYCEECSGEGGWSITDLFLPYIDDKDVIKVYCDALVVKLPKSYAVEKGLVPKMETEPTPISDTTNNQVQETMLGDVDYIPLHCDVDVLDYLEQNDQVTVEEVDVINDGERARHVLQVFGAAE